MIFQRVVRALAALLLAVTVGGCGVGGVTAVLASKSGSDDSGSGGPPPIPELAPVPPDPGLYKSLEGAARGLALGDFVPEVGHIDAVVIFDSHPQRVAVLQGDGKGGLKAFTVREFEVAGTPTIGVTTVPGPEGGLDGILVWTATTLELARWDDATSAFAISRHFFLEENNNRDAVLGDFNPGDGLDEVAVTGEEDQIVIFQIGTVDGTFDKLTSFTAPGRVISLSAANFCDDRMQVDPKRWTDLAILSEDGGTNRVDLYCNPFTPGSSPTATDSDFPHPVSHITKGGDFDMNGDGQPDIATIRTGGTGSVFVHRTVDATDGTITISLESLGRGGAHVSPDPTELILTHLPGGNPKRVDRITSDGAFNAVICSYFVGKDKVEKTISYALPGPGVALASGDLNEDEDEVEDLVALAVDASTRSTATVLLANSPTDPAIKTSPFYYALASARPSTVPALLDIGFGRDFWGMPFLVGIDRNNEELKVFFLDKNVQVQRTQTIGGLSSRPAGIRVRNFDQIAGDDIVVIADTGIYLFLALADGSFSEAPTLYIPLFAAAGETQDLFHADPFLCAGKADSACKQLELNEAALKEHVAAVSIDNDELGLPDLVVPISTESTEFSQVAVILNPARFGTDEFSVRFFRTVPSPRQVTVAKMNRDAAPDLLLAGSLPEASRIQVLFGNPAAPGTFFDKPTDPLPPLELIGPPVGTGGGFEEVHTSNSLLEEGELPFSDWPPAEWIIASKGDRVYFYCFSGPGGTLTQDDISSADEGLIFAYNGRAPEAIHVRDLFGRGIGFFDLVLTDEDAGTIPFLRYNGIASGCPSWTPLGNDLEVKAPQHFASFSLDGSFFLAVASRHSGTVEVFQRETNCPDCKFKPHSSIPLAPQRQPHQRTHLSVYRSKDVTDDNVWAARLIDFQNKSGVRPRVELVSLSLGDTEDQTLVTLGRMTNGVSTRETTLPLGKEITGILLTEVHGDRLPDLLVSRAGETWVTCHKGLPGAGPPFDEEGERIDSLAEPVQDWQIAGESPGALDILVADSKQVSHYSLTLSPTPMHMEKKLALGFEKEPAEQIAVSRRGEPLCVAILQRGKLRVQYAQEPPVSFEYPDKRSFACVGVHDINGRGKLDVAVVDPENRKLWVFLDGQQPGPGLGMRYKDYVVPVEIAFADMNGDDHVDVAFGAKNGEVYVFRSDGKGRFDLDPVVLYAGPGLEALKGCDTDGDGIEDTLVAVVHVPGLVVLTSVQEPGPADLTSK